MTDDRSPQPSATANRAQRNARRKKKTTPALLVVPVVLVLGAVALFFFLRDGKVRIPIIGGDDHQTEVPSFEFKIRKARAVATDEKADPKALAEQAASIGRELTPMLDDLFTAAFLDPANWDGGDYEDVWAHFDEGSRAVAEQNVETLTLGASAGDVYDEVAPTKGSLEFDVLFDPEGAPDSVVVKFRFYAFGARSDGTYTAIVSHGQLFLEDNGGWSVTAFDVIRNDRGTESPAPPAPAPSASGSASSSSSSSS